MRALIWFFRGVLFLLLVAFAVKNDHVTTLRFFFGNEWPLPLVFIILIAFLGGAIFGMTASVISRLALHREIFRLKKQARAAESAGDSPAGGAF
jgi:uncharacterized integral membrane protein